MKHSDTATRRFLSLRALRALAGLLGCYAIAGFAWWNTLGCGAALEFAGLVSIHVSPVLAGHVSMECDVFDPNGDPVGCPTLGTGVENIGLAYPACLTAIGDDFSRWGESCLCDDAGGTVAGAPCDGPNQCFLRVANGAQVVCVANFDCDAFELSVEVIGTGKVESDPAGIECESGVCRSSFCDVAVPGIASSINLFTSERLGSGQVFAGFEGDPDCEDGLLTMDADKSCIARFRVPVLSVSATGAGRVTGLPGLACREDSPPEDCERSAALDSFVTLVADPDPGAQLIAWGGDCPDGADSSRLVMAGDQSCTASFTGSGVGGSGLLEIVSRNDDESLADFPVNVADEELSGSADLSVVAFRSGSTFLEEDPEPSWIAYARNRDAGTTQAITPPALAQPSELSLSADGIFVAYEHAVSGPGPGFTFHVYRRDLRSDTEELISVDFPVPSQLRATPVISGNGRFVAYRAELAGGGQGIVVRDTCSGAAPAESCVPHSSVVSYDPSGVLISSPQGPTRISRDGRFVLFHGDRASVQGPELFLHDRDGDVDGIFDEPGSTSTIFAAPDPTGGVLELHYFDRLYDLDASGRYVAFQSPDPDLPNTGGATDFDRSYLRDTCAGAPAGCVPSYSMLSVRQDGTPTTNTPFTLLSDLSGSGRYAMFFSGDGLLVGSDPSAFQNRAQSVLRDTCVGAPPGCTPGNVLVSRLGDGSPLSVNTRMPRVSDDGGAAVCFGPRQAVVSAPNASYDEVLFAPTGVVQDPGLAPAISGRSPASVPAGSPELLLTLNGSNFAPAVRVLWNGVSRQAIFISPRKLQLRLSAADLATAGPASFRVANPGGLTSNQVSFVVN